MPWPNLSAIDLPNAVTADEWQRRGNEFEPDLHFTGLCADVAKRIDKPRGARVAANNEKRIAYLIGQHGAHVVAYWLQQGMLPGSYSLELQFVDENAAEVAHETWRRLKNGSIKV